MIRGAFGNGYKGAHSTLEVTLGSGLRSWNLQCKASHLRPWGRRLNGNQVQKRTRDLMEASSRHRPLQPCLLIPSLRMVPPYILSTLFHSGLGICWRRTREEGKGEALRVSTRDRTRFYGAWKFIQLGLAP